MSATCRRLPPCVCVCTLASSLSKRLRPSYFLGLSTLCPVLPRYYRSGRCVCFTHKRCELFRHKTTTYHPKKWGMSWLHLQLPLIIAHELCSNWRQALSQPPDCRLQIAGWLSTVDTPVVSRVYESRGSSGSFMRHDLSFITTTSRNKIMVMPSKIS